MDGRSNGWGDEEMRERQGGMKNQERRTKGQGKQKNISNWTIQGWEKGDITRCHSPSNCATNRARSAGSQTTYLHAFLN